MMKTILAFTVIALTALTRVEAELPVVIIDAGHGGPKEPAVVDESRWNSASFFSEVRKRNYREKDLALEVALRIAERINAGNTIKAVLTRTSDRNVGMAERASVGHRYKAKAFVSIHFNSTSTAKGPLAIIQSVKHGNTPQQHSRDETFGFRLAKAVEEITRKIDSGSRARPTQDYDIKPEGSHLFSNLRSRDSGRTMNACFLEIEFLDNP